MSKDLRGVTVEKVLAYALEVKGKLDEHISQTELDMSLEESLLAYKYPEEYDLNVNGIRHIHVVDGDVELRYLWRDGKLVQLKQGVF